MAYLRLATAFILVIFIASCSKDDEFLPAEQMQEIDLNSEVIVFDGQTNAREGSGMNISFRSGGNFYVNQMFIDVENEVTGTSGDDYVWECCLGIGHFGEQGQLLYLKRGNSEKPALFYAQENQAGDDLESYGVIAYWRVADGYYQMPFDSLAPELPILADGNFVDNLSIDIGGWGTSELNFRIPGVTPAGYPEEYCMRILMPFGHNENGNIVTCMKNGVEQFVFEGKHKVFRLTTDDGSGTLAEFLIVQGLYNGLPAMFAVEDYPAYNIVAGDPILRASMPGPGTEITRILVEYLHGGVWDAKYAFPTLIASDIHGTDGIGCPISLKEIPSLECPIDCDSATVDCSNAELDLDKINDCATDTIVSAPAPANLIGSVEALLGSGDYKLRRVEHVDDGFWAYSRFNPGACKAGDWMFSAWRETSGNWSLNRAMIGFKNGQWGIAFPWQTQGGNVSFYPWDANGSAFNVTVNGQTFTWMFSNNISNNGMLELQKLENKAIPVMLNATNQIGEIRMPHEALGIIKKLGSNIYANGVDDSDGKVIEVEEKECFYQIMVDNQSFSAPDANIASDQRLVPGIDLNLENLYFYVLNDDGSVSGRILIRVGFAPVTVIYGGEAFYPPISTVGGIGELIL